MVLNACRKGGRATKCGDLALPVQSFQTRPGHIGGLVAFGGLLNTETVFSVTLRLSYLSNHPVFKPEGIFSTHISRQHRYLCRIPSNK